MQQHYLPATVVIDRMMRKTGKTIADLREYDRHPEVVQIRHKLMRDLYHQSGWSYCAIARLLGRDHSTAIYAVTGKLEKRRAHARKQATGIERKRADNAYQ